MKFSVIGWRNYIKNGEMKQLLFCTRALSGENCDGQECKVVFPKSVLSVSVGSTVDVTYNDRGYTDSVEVL